MTAAMQLFADLCRYAALERQADAQLAAAREAPPGEERDEMLADALAARRRMHQLAQGQAT